MPSSSDCPTGWNYIHLIIPRVSLEHATLSLSFTHPSLNYMNGMVTIKQQVGVWECETVLNDPFVHFAASEVFEDPFSSHQEESPEGFSHNSIESALQRNRELGFQPRSHQEEVFSRSARSFITEEILEALRKADRKGRDVVVGLSNACCKWGCSKSEISSLCWGTFFLEQRRCRNMHTQPSSSTPHGSGVIFLSLSFSNMICVFSVWSAWTMTVFKCVFWKLLQMNRKDYLILSYFSCPSYFFYFIWWFSFVNMVVYTNVVLNWWEII